MQQIKLKRGLDLNMEGKAELKLTAVKAPAVFHIVPDHFAGATPKMAVKAGDVVKAGSPLFYDKAFPEMLFTSPVSGKVAEVVRGDRRKVMSINIEADATIAYAEFDMKKDTKALLLESGLWTLIKQRPYDCIAMPSKTPKAVFISAFDSAPLAPDYEWAVEINEVQAAIDALSKLAPIYVGVRAGSKFAQLKGCTLFEVAGPHPAGNVGVQINHILPMGKADTMFCVNIQDAAVIGRFMTTGKVDYTKKVAVTGPMAKDPQYYQVLPGMPVSSFLAPGSTDRQVRYINGNALSGLQITTEDFVSPYTNQYTLIAEGSETHEFMGWLVRVFGIQGYKWDARLKGGRRAIIVSNEYDKVFPMDIYPEYLIKAMIAGNLEKELELGANEVAPEDFALCEYLCTSKMPLQAIVREALDNLKKEIE